MAQDIIITPRSGEPSIDFTGSGTTASSISLKVLSDSTLSFEGTQGQLFSITDNLTSGVIFGVNDIGGLPLIEASANGNVSLVRYGNNVGIGTGSPTAKLDILETWNTSAVQTGIKLNVIDASSNANSLLMDLQNSGSSRFKVAKGGITTITNPIGVGVLTLNSEHGGMTFNVWGGPRVDVPGEWRAGSAFSIGSGSDLIYLVKDSNNVLAQRRASESQTFRIYNTYTNVSNYERAAFNWNASAFEIETEASGTGLARNLILGTSSTPRIFVSSTGQIGIGTERPTVNLHISGTGTPTIALTNTFNDTLAIQNTGGGRSGFIGMGTSKHQYGGAWIYSFVETFQDWYTNSNVGVMRLQNGKLFIGGLLEGSQRLHVSGNAIVTSGLNVGSNITFGVNAGLIGGGTRLPILIGSVNVASFQYQAGDTPRRLNIHRDGLLSWATTADVNNTADTWLSRASEAVVRVTSSIEALSSISAPTVSALNYYNTSGALPTTLQELYDVSSTALPAEGYILIYTGGKWVALPPVIDGGSA